MEADVGEGMKRLDVEAAVEADVFERVDMCFLMEDITSKQTRSPTIPHNYIIHDNPHMLAAK